MTHHERFTDLLILGNGYSACLAAIALAPILPIKTMIAPPRPQTDTKGPERLVGQHAHSHIFLPRLKQELHRIDPDLLIALAQRGYSFVSGSYRLGPDAPIACQRLFATRWQFDGVIEAIFRDGVTVGEIAASVTDFQVDSDRISTLTLTSRDTLNVSATTLVLDAMGTKSPIMKTLSRKVSAITDQPGNIVYITQFFQCRDEQQTQLPDPLIDCPHDFGKASVMLYPGADGWFSVSLAIAIDQKTFIREMRDPEAFLAFCNQSPKIMAWTQTADAIGPNRIFINPRNRWNVKIFQAGTAPANYLAVGDALTTMLPTLGANCSFAATHIRIIRDLLASESADLQGAFSRAVHEEQYEFFQKALAGKAGPGQFIPFDASPHNRLSKRIKRKLRRLLGLDRARIIKQLSNSSSL
jgi:hypothetical protein